MPQLEQKWLPVLGSLLIFLISSSCTYTLSVEAVTHEFFQSYSTSRRQAVVDFVTALQMDDGLFVDKLDTYYSERDPVVSSYAVVLLSWLNGLSTITLHNLLDYCIAYQNLDGGFGLTSNDQSTLSATLVIIRLMFACNHINDVNQADAINWVYTLQCEDGGFTNAPPAGTQSGYLWDTTNALEALVKLGEVSFLNHNDIVNHIINRQNSDGGFSLSPGEDSSNIGTFYAIKALFLLNELERIDIENVTEYVKASYDPGLELIVPLTLAGIHKPYLTLSYLGKLDAVNVDEAADFILSLQSHLHGAFVSNPEEVDDRREEKIRASHDLIEVLIQLGKEERLNENFEVQETPVWNELTTPLPPLPPEVVVVFIVVFGLILAFSIGFLLYTKKPKVKKKIKQRKKR
ncbi:MAG: prenyltransferase/squalene oxidase repeat-containing protein [Candidatus Thorarchaeota archaeon]